LSFAAPSHRHRATPAEDRSEHAFVFRNTSDQPVIIAALRTPCDCTTATVAKQIYAPGEEGRIDVVFEFADRTGPQTEVIPRRFLRRRQLRAI